MNSPRNHYLQVDPTQPIILVNEHLAPDPHAASDLTIDDIVELCDDLIEAHGRLLPSFA